MKAIIILSLLVLSCFASHHLRRHHKELTPAQIAKILKGLSGHGGSSGSGSGSGSNEEFDFEGDQLAAKKKLTVEEILQLIQEGVTAGKDVDTLLKQLKEDRSGSSSSGSGSGSNQEFDFEADQFAAKKQSKEDKIEQEIQEALLAGKDVTGLLQLLKQIKSLGGNGGSSSGSGSGSNEELDFEADQFAAKKHLNLQQVIALIAKYEAEGKDITKLMQIYNARSSGNNQEFDFEADEFAAKKKLTVEEILQLIQEGITAGKDVDTLLKQLKEDRSGSSDSGSGSGSGSNEEFDFEADQFHKKQPQPTRIISVIHDDQFHKQQEPHTVISVIH